jgi:molybdopterin-guanine dinucleotide biosynthesis protein A
MICGVILAGGRSRRFGREKAAAEIGGVPMLWRVAGVLRPHVAALAINAGPGSWAAQFAAEAGLPLLPDTPGDPDGPLSGVRAGLAWAIAAGAEALVTAPCDTPYLPQDLVPRLVQGLPPAAGAAAARTVDGLQPLCALWRCDRLAAIHAVVAGSSHPAVHATLAALGAVEIDFEDARAFENINTPQDHARALCGQTNGNSSSQ